MTGVDTTVQRKRKTKVGRVVSDRMDKTIVVSVERLARHRLYKRVIRLTTKFTAHDDLNEAAVGDTVLIEESRPLSRTKRWRLVEILQRAGAHGIQGELVSEEEATSEAIHGAAHPGRIRPGERADGTTSGEDGAVGGARSAGDDAAVGASGAPMPAGEEANG
jgi:small subunit ribosomal protein S17